MLGFEQTATGYRATDAQVAWWRARDICPSCTAIVEPVQVDHDGLKHYSHDCGFFCAGCGAGGPGPRVTHERGCSQPATRPIGPVEWTAYSPADTAGL